MDNEQERNEHFKGFAKLLWQDLMGVHDGWIDVSDAGLDEEDITHYQQIIAQRTYDLASFAVYKSMRGCSLAQIPDITEWSTLTEDRKFDVD